MDTVVRLHWPAEAERRAALAGVARLLLVAPGAPPPPAWDLEEDWVRLPADDVELAARTEALRRRTLGPARAAPARPRLELDQDGLLHRADRWVALSPVEASIVAVLVRGQGTAVRREVLADAAWGGATRPERAVDGVVRRVRRKVARLDLAIHGLAGVGYLLDAA